jgi:hypothetical protein
MRKSFLPGAKYNVPKLELGNEERVELGNEESFLV